MLFLMLRKVKLLVALKQLLLLSINRAVKTKIYPQLDRIEFIPSDFMQSGIPLGTNF